MKVKTRKNTVSKIYLDVRNICKSYIIRGKRYNVLSNIKFSVASDEFVGVIGSSGNGKSTLFNCITGFENVDNGLILYFDQNFTEMSDGEKNSFRDKNIGIVFANNNLVEYLTSAENILLHMQNVKISDRNNRLNELINFFEINEIADVIAENLTSYEKILVALAKALSKSPRILILDEPDANLKSDDKDKLIQILKRVYFEFKIPIVIFSADPKIAMSVGRVIRINNGKIV